MSTNANDKFKIYFQEKIWELIPGVYRHEDGLDTNPNPHVLRAIVEVIAEQAAILRRSQDRLWEDQFIELCNDWAVPYIGDLLGTRILSALNIRGRRIDVAKTIYYRRRKGTPRILEELIKDIADWDGKLVEAFMRLGRARHLLDPLPGTLAGRFTGTLPGGFADLRLPVASDLADGPFEEYFHTPDFRKPNGLDGRYGITKLNFYLYRLYSLPVFNATPFMVAADRFCFDPSGREIQLFSKRNRPDKIARELWHSPMDGNLIATTDGTALWENWHSALEWELPLPIRCRLLGHAEYEITEEALQKLTADGLPVAQVTLLHKLLRQRFRNESELRRHTDSFLTAAFYPLLLKYAIVADCGKNQLLPGSMEVAVSAPIGTITKEKIRAANLVGWGVNASDKLLVIDPVRGLFRFFVGMPVVPLGNVLVDYHYGFAGQLGAGTYDRREVEDIQPTVNILPGPATIDFALMNPTETVQVDDNQTYSVISDPPSVQKFIVQTANQLRPYLQLTKDLVFTSTGNDATLILDGLWLGSPGNKQFNIVLNGDYECVIIRNCTLDPGNDKNLLNENINPVSLIINATVEKICIAKSILGPIHTDVNGIIEEEIKIMDSIVQAGNPAVAAIDISTGKTTILRSTLFGEVKVHRLYASDTIITGLATVMDTQSGCFRYSAAPKKVGATDSRLPRPYEYYLFEKDTQHWFSSRRFGNAAFAQLSDTAPVEIFRGAENGAEMGVFNHLLNAIKYDGLKGKIEEYMPFGLIPALINET